MLRKFLSLVLLVQCLTLRSSLSVKVDADNYTIYNFILYKKYPRTHPSQDIPPFLESLARAWKTCTDKTYTEMAITELIHKANEPEAECLIECYLKKLKILENNRLDPEGVDSIMEVWFGEKNDVALKIGRECTTFDVPDWSNCTGMHETLTCYVNESEKVKLFSQPLNKKTLARLVEKVIEEKIEEKLEEKREELSAM